MNEEVNGSNNGGVKSLSTTKMKLTAVFSLDRFSSSLLNMP